MISSMPIPARRRRAAARLFVCLARGLLALLLALIANTGSATRAASAQALQGLGAPLVLPGGAADGAAEWGDYDNDSDLDLLVTGIGTNGQRATILYRNTGGSLVEVPSGLPRLESSSVDWGDYDNDGYLDVVLTGKEAFANNQIIGKAGVYHNVPDPANPSQRTLVAAFTLPNIYQGWAEWGDYNNDGRLDILLTGHTDGGLPLTRVYRSNGDGTFTDAVTGLVNLGGSHGAWGDYNKDGFLDFVVMGRDAAGVLRTLVYRNLSASGFDAPLSMPGLYGGDTDWIDVENDGDLDLVLTGNQGDNGGNIVPTTLVYKYAAGAFTLMTGTGLYNIWQSSVSVGDYNNDGYSDLLVNGLTSSDRPTRVYINNRNFTFTDAAAGLPNASGASVAWGDFNRDGTLDLAVTGVTVLDAYTTQIFINNQIFIPSNSAPATPLLRAACWDGGSRLTLEWELSSDDHPALGGSDVTYNLRIGSGPGAINLLSPHSNTATGYRRVAQPGNVFSGANAVMLTLLKPNTYYWAVQGVDASYVGSPFSAEGVAPLGTAVAAADSFTTAEDTPVSISLLANDNPAFAPLSVYTHSSPAHGTLAGGANGVYTYTPAANWSGTDSFTYRAIGGSRYCSQATVTITVTPVNDAPSALNLSNSSVYEALPAGTPVGSFSAADPDPTDSFTYTLVPAGQNNYANDLFQVSGSSLLTRSVFSYAQGTQYTINARVTDTGGLSFTKQFAISILPTTPVSIACLAGCAGFLPGAKTASVRMSEDGAPDPFNLSLAANDPGAAETLTWSIAAAPAHAALSLGGTTVSGQAKSIQYAPEPDWFGDDSFVVRVTDPLGNSDQISVNVSVAPVNDPPTLDALPNRLYTEWPGERTVTLAGISPGPANESGQPLTITAQTSDPNLVCDLTAEYPGAGSTAVLRFYITGSSGTALVTVTTSDGQAGNAITTRAFTVTVVPGPVVFLPLIERP